MKKYLIIFCIILLISGLVNATENVNNNSAVNKAQYYVGLGLGANLGVSYSNFYAGLGYQFVVNNEKIDDCYLLADDNGKVCGGPRIDGYNYDTSVNVDKMSEVYASIGFITNNGGINFGLTLDLAKNGVGSSLLLQGQKWGVNMGAMLGKLSEAYYDGYCDNSWWCYYDKEKRNLPIGFHINVTYKIN